MCGIAGSLGTPEAVPGLLDALEHRGPDHRGRWRDGDVALGAARLRIRGDASSDMPLVDESQAIRLVGNGEIFNHRELFPLREGGSDLSGLADLWREEGVALLPRLRGPFALAFWDARDRSLTLARDEYGVRPLHFEAADGRTLRFASEPAALLAGMRAPRPDLEAWDQLFALQFWPAERTPWRGIETVPPGTWVRFVRVGGRLRQTRGRFRWEGDAADPARARDEAFALQAGESVRSGITLSGGLDSSAVLGGLELAGHRPALAAVGWFPEGGAGLDERAPARARAAESSVPLLEVAITAEAWWEAAGALTSCLGAPLAGPGGPSQRLVAEALAREGVRVVFSGQGGDELFGGYERHRLLQQMQGGASPIPAPGYEPLAAALSRRGPKALLDRAHGLAPWLEPERRRGVDAVLASLPGEGATGADDLLAFEIANLLPGLLAIEDATCAAFGMEGRVPLLDPGLAAAARGLPLAQKSPPEAPRALFRKLMASHLGVAATRRDKMGFPLPLAAWLKGPLRPLLFDHPGLDRLGELGLRPGVRGAMQRGELPPRTVAFLLSAAESLVQRDAAVRVEVAR